jgi:hypothetical protein
MLKATACLLFAGAASTAAHPQKACHQGIEVVPYPLR